MHSLSMAQNILQAALTEAERNDAKSIRTISMRVAEDFDECDTLRFCLELFSRGTIAEGAGIEIERVDGCFAGHSASANEGSEEQHDAAMHAGDLISVCMEVE